MFNDSACKPKNGAEAVLMAAIVAIIGGGIALAGGLLVATIIAMFN